MLSLLSPAKINLFLRILKRRFDGYHELASLFQTIDLHDRLHLRISAYDNLSTTHPALATDSSNLIWKAINLFRYKTDFSARIEAFLEKNIPLEAGLGGGSSNAATALFGLNVLAGYPASQKELMLWSAELGSDVPFFFSTGTAYCTGRGEEVHVLPPLKAPEKTSVSENSLWVIKKPFGLSTPKVYATLQLDKLPTRRPEKALAAFLAGRPTYFNDLEQAAFRLVPELAAFKQQLLELGFSHVFLAGSGSSFIGLGSPKPSFEELSAFKHSGRYIYRRVDSWYELPM